MSRLESEALCPYYQRDEKLIIRCEGGDIFCRDKEMYREIGYGMCANNYDGCIIKKSLDGFYDRKEKKSSKL